MIGDKQKVEPLFLESRRDVLADGPRTTSWLAAVENKTRPRWRQVVVFHYPRSQTSDFSVDRTTG